MMKDEGVSVKIVPYQGGGAPLLAVLAGHTDMGGASTVQCEDLPDSRREDCAQTLRS